MTYNECPICFEEHYNNHSSTLKCGHKMCSQCLVSHAATSQKVFKGYIDCPLCRSVIVRVSPPILPVLPARNNSNEIGDIQTNPEEFERIKKLGLILCGLLLFFLIPYLLMSVLKDISQISIDDDNIGYLGE